MPIDAFEDLPEPAARSVADWEEVQFESHSPECTGSATTLRYSVSAPMAPPGEWGSGISTQRNEGTDASVVNYFEGHHSCCASEDIWTRLPSKSPQAWSPRIIVVRIGLYLRSFGLIWEQFTTMPPQRVVSWRRHPLRWSTLLPMAMIYRRNLQANTQVMTSHLLLRLWQLLYATSQPESLNSSAICNKKITKIPPSCLLCLKQSEREINFDVEVSTSFPCSTHGPLLTESATNVDWAGPSRSARIFPLTWRLGQLSWRRCSWTGLWTKCTMVSHAVCEKVIRKPHTRLRWVCGRARKSWERRFRL